MELFLIHILKSSGLLSIFFIAYHFLLRRDTTFTKNRFFLLAGILCAAILPFVHFTQKVVVNTTKATTKFADESGKAAAVLPGKEVDLWQLMGMIYLVVAAFLLSKFIFQILRIASVAFKQSNQKEEDFFYVPTKVKTSPFSFFKMIVFNPATHSEEELRMVLEHERVHSRQLHSMDILLANLAAILLWFNPLSWKYRKCVEENLEYIADRETVKSLGKQKEYQYALLRVSQQSVFPGLLNHFHRSFIKNRILMLQTDPSNNRHEWKCFLVLPILLLFLLACNTEEELVFPNKKGSYHSDAKMEHDPVFYIDSNTSDAYFRGMESYFRDNHPDFQIAFTGITRDADLSLTGFQVETKFEGEDRFTKRMENLGKKKLKPSFAIQYSQAKKALIITEQHEQELQISITKEAIHADHIERSMK